MEFRLRIKMSRQFKHKQNQIKQTIYVMAIVMKKGVHV